MTIRTRYTLLLLIPLLGLVALCAQRTAVVQASTPADCHRSYPDFCIPSPPPDLDCPDIRGKKPFRVRPPDPHGFDRDRDGWACEPRPRRRSGS